MYGQSGLRGIVPTRALSFSLYVVALVVGVVMIPLVLIGPTLLGQFLPPGWDFLTALYWPVVLLLVIAAFTSLYHVSTPRRSPWTRDLPGAFVTLGIWVVASFAVRGTIAASLGGTSIYGPLSAPIVLLSCSHAVLACHRCALTPPSAPLAVLRAAGAARRFSGGASRPLRADRRGRPCDRRWSRSPRG